MIKVEPIRDLDAIKRIKFILADHPRNLCLFTFGINTAYRAGEMLSLTVGQVRHLRPGDRLEIRQSKTNKLRAVTLNQTVIDSIRGWLAAHPCPSRKCPLFVSRRGDRALTVPTVTNLVKSWCRKAGLHGNYGSHTLRKTWGYHQFRVNNAPIPLLMQAFGHTSQAQTLSYLCIEPDEIRKLYRLEL